MSSVPISVKQRFRHARPSGITPAAHQDVTGRAEFMHESVSVVVTPVVLVGEEQG